MAKQKLLIVEAGQGAGKTTITNLLREKMRYTNLLRLTGSDDPTILGEIKALKMYDGLLDYIEATSNCNVNFIFDRIFLSEYVYAQLGYKQYDFERAYRHLMERLVYMDAYDIHVVLLSADPDVVEKRLQRDKLGYLDMKFDAEKSLQQQNQYHKVMLDIMERYPRIHVSIIDTSTLSPDKLVEMILDRINIE
jgi:thymidylate kinase